MGHETDTTIIDLVSDHRASTPTNAAEFVCAPWREVKITLNQMEYTLSNSIERAIGTQRERLQSYQRYLSSRRISDNMKNLKEKIEFLIEKAGTAIRNRMQLNISLYKGLSGKLFAYSPEKTLKKGYVIIHDRNEKLLRSVEDLMPDDNVKLTFYDGSARAEVKSIDKGKNDE